MDQKTLIRKSLQDLLPEAKQRMSELNMARNHARSRAVRRMTDALEDLGVNVGELHAKPVVPTTFTAPQQTAPASPATPPAPTPPSPTVPQNQPNEPQGA